MNKLALALVGATLSFSSIAAEPVKGTVSKETAASLQEGSVVKFAGSDKLFMVQTIVQATATALPIITFVAIAASEDNAATATTIATTATN